MPRVRIARALKALRLRMIIPFDDLLLVVLGSALIFLALGLIGR
jgi:hypothetical protein